MKGKNREGESQYLQNQKLLAWPCSGLCHHVDPISPPTSAKVEEKQNPVRF